MYPPGLTHVVKHRTRSPYEIIPTIKKVNTEWLGSTHGHFGEDRELLVIWKVFSRRLKGFELSPRQ